MNGHFNDLNLSSLVRAALDGDAREGITHLLKNIAMITESFGCVLWRATQDAIPPHSGELTMLASWFEVTGSYFGITSADFKTTLAGKAAINSKAWEVDNELESNLNPNRNRPFFKLNNLDRCLACRFEFLPRAGQPPRLGVLMIFRTRTSPPFGASDVTLLQGISKVLPLLYSGARQKASYGLLKEIGEILRAARKDSRSGQSLKKAHRKKVLKQVCEALEKTFHSMETSIFLEDERKLGQYCCAYTSEGPHRALVKKTVYEPSTDRGFSPLSLIAKEPMRVHDLLNPSLEIEVWKRRFPKFEGPQGRELANAVLNHLGNPAPPPPLSMMVAPLVANEEPLGFLRCWVAKSGPSYFSSDDLDLLRLVADFLSETIAGWTHERRTSEMRKKEYIALTTLAKKSAETKSELFSAALSVASRILPEAEFNTVRLRTDSPDQLYYVIGVVSTAFGISEGELRRRLVSERTTLPGPSLAAKVVKKKEAKSFRGVALESHKADVSESAGELIIAPILVNNHVEGVLDLRTRKNVKFNPQARVFAESISALLALLFSKERAEEKRIEAERHRLIAEFQATKEIADNERHMRDAFEDVAHQIKSPLAEAARRVEATLKECIDFTTAQELTAIAGLLRRAEHIAKQVGLFASLAKGRPLSVSRTSLTPIELINMVTNICDNQRPRISQMRNIRLLVDAESFLMCSPSELRADEELLTQALNCVIDNAIKYSYPESTIRVFAAELKKAGFFIGITNRGITIKPQEINLVRERNWRGEAAKNVTGEGNGLGLYFVNHIMKAHGGELIVLPTRQNDNITEIRLAFRSI